MTRTILLFLMLGCISYGARSQQIQRVSASIFNESIAFPFTRFIPIHLGGEIGVTLNTKPKNKTLRNWNVALGGYHHERVENGIYLRGEYVYRPIIKSNFTVDLIGGVGYLHTFYPGEVYERNSSGEFEKIKQKGRAHALATLGVGISYIKNEDFQPFIRQEIGVESPFANGIPVIIHSFLKAGISIKVDQK